MRNSLKLILIFIVIVSINCNNLEAKFFQDISNLISKNTPRLSYGIAVTDIDNDGNKDRPYTISWDEPNVRWVATDKADPVGNWRWDVTSLAWVSI